MSSLPRSRAFSPEAVTPSSEPDEEPRRGAAPPQAPAGDVEETGSLAATEQGAVALEDGHVGAPFEAQADVLREERSHPGVQPSGEVRLAAGAHEAGLSTATLQQRPRAGARS